MAIRTASVRARTVAVRVVSSSSAISPSTVPGPRTASSTSRPLAVLTTSNSPALHHIRPIADIALPEKLDASRHCHLLDHLAQASQVIIG